MTTDNDLSDADSGHPSRTERREGGGTAGSPPHRTPRRTVFYCRECAAAVHGVRSESTELTCHGRPMRTADPSKASAILQSTSATMRDLIAVVEAVGRHEDAPICASEIPVDATAACLDALEAMGIVRRHVLDTEDGGHVSVYAFDA